MEGIETNEPRDTAIPEFMSVGAPTWRGLKLFPGDNQGAKVYMSVGAPTWRGLKRWS